MYEQLGKMVEYHRKKLKVSRQRLAEMADVGKTVIFDIEKGKASVQINTLMKVLSALEIGLVFRTPTVDIAFKGAKTD